MLHLPKPVLESYWWQQYGACRDTDVELFFYADNERGRPRRSRAERAKAICDGCPVLDLCRNHALQAELYGVWGGTTEEEREQIRAQTTHPLTTVPQPAAVGSGRGTGPSDAAACN